MKTSKFFLSTLIAASAMTATAWALDIENGQSLSVDTQEVESVYFNLKNDAQEAILNVNKSGTFTISGESVSPGDTRNSAVSLGYAGNAIFNVNGTLNILNADGFGTEYSRFTMTVNDGGIANLKSIKQTVSNGWHDKTSSVTLSEGGTLNLGDGGYTCQSINSSAGASRINLTLNGGTLGALDSWSTSDNLSATGTVTLNTTKYDAVNATYLSEGATIVANGGLSGEGKFIISGLGTVRTNALSVATVEVSSDATLDLSGAMVSLSSEIANAGTITVSDTTKIDLANFRNADGSFSTNVISGNAASGWENLNVSNFTYKGVEFSEARNATLGSDGMISVSGANLVWAGTISANWNTTDKNWTGVDDGLFYNFDNVTFNSDSSQKTVELSGNIVVGTMNVSDDYAFSGSGVVLAGHSLTIASGKTMTLGAGQLSLNFDDIVLNGTLTVNTNQDQANSWKQLTFSGGTLNIQDSGDNPITIKKTIVNGSGVISATWGCPIDLGEVLGEGATLTLSGSTSDAKMTYIISGTSAIGTLVQKGGTLNVSGNVTASQLRMAEEGTSALTIKSGSILTITGDNNDHSTDSSLLLSHGANKATLNLSGGKLLAEDAVMRMSWDGTGTFSAQSGEARLKGLNFWGTGNGGAALKGHFVLGSENDGSAKVYLGASGMAELTDNGDNISVKLGNGTLGAMDDWSTSYNSSFDALNIQLVGIAGGTVFDTQDPDDAVAHTITINNKLVGTGKLVKTGAGTLRLMKDNTYSGGTTIEAGTLVVAHKNALGTGKLSATGGILKLNADADFAIEGTVALDRFDASETNPTSIAIDFGSDGMITTSASSSQWGGGINFGTGVKTKLDGGVANVTFTIALTQDQMDSYLANGTLNVERVLLSATNSYDGLDAGADGIWNLNETQVLKIIVENTTGGVLASSTGTLSSAGNWSWENDGLSNVGFNVTMDAGAGTDTATLTLTIPEPSAFGLLAGVGALALVVSRRRRSRR